MRPLASFLILASVLALLLLAGCVTPPSPPPGQPVAAPPVVEQNTSPPPVPSTPAPADLSPCQDAGNVLLRDQCYLKMAVERRDMAWCNRIYSSAIGDSCINAFTSQDAGLCEKLSDSNFRQDCFDAVARRLNDTNYCVRLSNADRKSACLKALSPACSFEQTPEKTQLCLALNHSDASYCKSNACYFEYGITMKNSTACANISGERALQLACQAASQNERSYCNADNISTIADYCYQLVAYRLNDSNWCNWGSEGSPYRNGCYLHFAVQEINPGLCRRASGEMERDNCYMNFSILTDSPSVCPSVINSLIRNQCYIDTAKKNGDASACNGLIGRDAGVCYNLVLIGPVPLRDPLYCRNVNDDLWRDKCYLQLASQTGNRSICDLIASPDYQRACAVRLS